MKKMMFEMALAAAALALCGCSQRQMLFNGRNLDGWKPQLADASVTPEAVWSVKDGILRCEGKPNGYIRTTKTFSDYRLHVEWRWPQEPANSGVFLHATGPDKVWPLCIEAQLANGKAGDFVAIGAEARITVNGTEYRPLPDKTSRGVAKQHPSSENPAGQWNTYDILCKEGTIRLYVNNVLQNTGTNAYPASGSICLQSEGGPIEFRNVYIERLK